MKTFNKKISYLFIFLFLVIYKYSLAQPKKIATTQKKNSGGSVIIKNNTNTCEVTSLTLFFDEPTKIINDIPQEKTKIKIIRPKESHEFKFFKEPIVVKYYTMEYNCKNESLKSSTHYNSFSVKIGETKTINAPLPTELATLIIEHKARYVLIESIEFFFKSPTMVNSDIKENSVIVREIYANKPVWLTFNKEDINISHYTIISRILPDDPNEKNHINVSNPISLKLGETKRLTFGGGEDNMGTSLF